MELNYEWTLMSGIRANRVILGEGTSFCPQKKGGEKVDDTAIATDKKVG